MVCDTCNRPFEPAVKGQGTCTSCLISPRATHFNKRIPMTVKNCKDCDKPFELSAPNQKICPDCKQKNDLIAKVEADKETFTRAHQTVKEILLAPNAPGMTTIKDTSLGALAQGALAFLGCNEATFVVGDITIHLKRSPINEH